LSFLSLSWSKIRDKLAINWQHIARVPTSAQVCFHNTAPRGVANCLGLDGIFNNYTTMTRNTKR